MSITTPAPPPTETEPEHLDVLIVGAGLSGIGSAIHLHRDCPDRSFAVLESRPVSGGTWDLFRYPGIRSDSDMFTLGYSFKSWLGEKAIADGDSILDYVREAAAESGIEQRIRYSRRVVSASWSSEDARWSVEVANTENSNDQTAPLMAATERLTCDFLFGCSGYYRYDEGFTPQFAGIEDFEGELIHPQHWPTELDYAGKRIVVIGSGATAMTLVPALARQAEQVTMLQRSPTYVISRPGRDPIAGGLRKLLPQRLAYRVIRAVNIGTTLGFYLLSRRAPGLVRGLLRKGVQSALPDDYPLDTDFKPSYNPWDQRICVVPDADLFRALRGGSASIVTDTIDRFTNDGILLESGKRLEADIIVTATGLNMALLGGGIELDLDGVKVLPSDTVAYKGMMLSGIPNFAFVIGYTNASWTLKSDLVGQYVARLLNHMRDSGQAVCVPLAPDPSEPTAPISDLSSGYVQRVVDELPRQGRRAPWLLRQNYLLDLMMFKHGGLENEGIRFTSEPTADRKAVAV